MRKPYSIVAVEPGPSNAIRAHQHPILEPGNLSFPEGRYELEFLPGEDRASFEVTHLVSRAPLIMRMLEERKAQCVCIVSSPISSYRKTHMSSTARQEVSWDAEELGEPPLFTPMIVCAEACDLVLSSSRDGVHKVWDGESVSFRRGSRLALGEVIRLESSILQLLSLHEMPELKDGQFEVDIETEPFKFRVNMSSSLHRFLRHREDAHRWNIMTHIVTACLARLQNDHEADDGESGWQSHRNLKAFADYLEVNGLEHWTDPEFRPEKVATALYPHVMPEPGVGEAGVSEEQ